MERMALKKLSFIKESNQTLTILEPWLTCHSEFTLLRIKFHWSKLLLQDSRTEVWAMNELLDVLEDKFKYTINPSLYFFLLVYNQIRCNHCYRSVFRIFQVILIIWLTHFVLLQENKGNQKFAIGWSTSYFVSVGGYWTREPFCISKSCVCVCGEGEKFKGSLI